MKYYHGTNTSAADSIINTGHRFYLCKNPRAEVGQGFYVTDFLPYSFIAAVCKSTNKNQPKKDDEFCILEYDMSLKYIKDCGLNIYYVKSCLMTKKGYIPIATNKKSVDVLYNKIADRVAMGARQLCFRSSNSENFLNTL